MVSVTVFPNPVKPALLDGTVNAASQARLSLLNSLIINDSKPGRGSVTKLQTSPLCLPYDSGLR